MKSNGRVPCWCDAGERHTITQKDITQHDFVREVVNGPEMREMRLSIIERQENFIKQCEKCCCMIRSDRNMHFRHITTKQEDLTPRIDQAKKQFAHAQKRRGWPHGSLTRLTEIQVEPTFPCNLRCPGCLHGKFKNPLEREDPPYVLPLDTFKRMVDSLIYNDMKVERISFVGRGEPTLNKDFTAMLDYCKPALPDTQLTIDTNSNQPYHESYDQIDWLNCSIDGSTPESYGTYRLGGNFDKTMDFMESAAGKRKNGKICWKYILFDTTDSDELLLRALRIARDLDIDCVWFIITSTGAHDKSVNPSKRTMPEMQAFLKSQTIFDKAVVRYTD